MARQVKDRKRRRGHTRISSKNQATLPVDALRAAGLEPGDELKVEAAGEGRIVLARTDDPVATLERFLGSMPDVYEPGYLEKLRSEWDR